MPLQKFWGDRAPAFVTEISGIVWVTNMSYDWLMVAFGNHQPIVTNASYPNDPRKPSVITGARSPRKFWSGEFVHSLAAVAGTQAVFQIEWCHFVQRAQKRTI